MPKFILDTPGFVDFGPTPQHLPGRPVPWTETTVSWDRLDDFTRGYIEAMFYTEGADTDDDLAGLGFSDLAPEALGAIMRDCAMFYEAHRLTIEKAALKLSCAHDVNEADSAAGKDFWFTRNGHGVGFWDGDWPEPEADKLDKAAETFDTVYPYVGQDGKVYL